MREDLDQERRATERQWAKRSKQIEAVTFTISSMYGDLQGFVPALPSIARLELLDADMARVIAAAVRARIMQPCVPSLS
jgi:hypothetical protein